ncbi:TPA: hypothetical protein N0F65_011289 [Lagenidium giganteum]|uniref:Uncharacterized protein n=1 Tax=Lagenidium giganteum TaxID=4803 RepID=A0AAV2YTR8_9STRA|nr:TPA: hypothetical protein N0F65_011289 [Lagenidium giganteum]
MGKVLVRWEVDSTVPFRFQQLGLLLASLFQFSRQQDYAHVEMKNGYSVVFSADAAAQIATAVVLRSPRHDKTRLSTACTDDLPVHVARLKSLIILREFLRSYADDIDALVASGKADAQAMADNYTLSSALQGVGGPLDEDVSCDVFLPFQANFIASIMERPLLEGLSEPAQNLSSKTIGGGSQREAQVLTRGFFMNAASGDVLSSFVPADMVVSATAAPVLAAIEGSNKVGTLLARVALAMHEAFPVLYQTSLMKRARINSHIGFSNSKVNSTTVVVRLKSQILSRLNTSQFFIALRMMPVRRPRRQFEVVVTDAAVLSGVWLFRV